MDTFAEYFEDVHGHRPFPWQGRLVASVLKDGRWPSLLDLPTGTGKTSAIDVALFTLAQRPDVFPRRIVLIVDRRVVVDQGADHARHIQARLGQASAGAAARLAEALRALSGSVPDEPPFTVAVLRGGMPRDEVWAERPDRPVVVVSTVDQVGSRLLFRGYGVSPGMAPIHAGLLGHDALLLLDEVHLSTAFAETLHAIERRWRHWHTGNARPLPDRWGFVRMSATPAGDGTEGVEAFCLDEDDRRDPVLSARLSARKLARLEPVRVAGAEEERVEQFARACADAARNYLARDAMAVAVVVNRVDTARRVHRLLREQPAPRPADFALLTGRMRPLDRLDAMGPPDDPASLARRIVAGRRREEETRPIVVVATQSIEAGADFDFDALVTECASLDALRQRFGRVDRRGALGETRATILARHDAVNNGADDPVYGGAIGASWAWLQQNSKASRGDIDFGVTRFPPLPAGDELRRLCSPAVSAPVLLPATIDAWVQTNPRPEPDPDPALWLHGPQRDVPEVSVLWRADIDPDVLNSGPDGGARVADGEADESRRREDVAARLAPRLAVSPPSSLESLSLPLPVVRAWLQEGSIGDVADVEGARAQNDAPRRHERREWSRLCLCVRHDATEVVDATGLRPGDTLVVPSTYGGIAFGNWDPQATSFVPDLGDWAQFIHRGRAVVRLVPEVLAGALLSVGEVDIVASRHVAAWCPSGLARAVPKTADSEDVPFDAQLAVEEWLAATSGQTGERLRLVLAAMDGGARAHRVIEIGDGRLAVIGRRPVRPVRWTAEGALPVLTTEDDDSGSFATRVVTLRDHLAEVRAWSRTFAERLGFGLELMSDIMLAAWLHDVGKADPRFQQMLLGGSEVRLMVLREPLAKSSGDPADAHGRTAARERATYPHGYRHELLSVAMVAGSDGALSGAHDAELVLHLVGSHHGWCRPFAPARDPGAPLAVELSLDGMALRADAAHDLARVDSGAADRFFDLVERYGWWGLAWLEAVVRLADHRASALGESERRAADQRAGGHS
jgi:CRISPR-associated endonuclease/helicase Cas3